MDKDQEHQNKPYYLENCTDRNNLVKLAIQVT